jgi:hypothetical protein
VLGIRVDQASRIDKRSGTSGRPLDPGLRLRIAASAIQTYAEVALRGVMVYRTALH